jgi:hypothetical protein
MTSPGEWIERERRRRGWTKIRLCDEIQRWEYQHGNGDHLGLNPNYVLQSRVPQLIRVLGDGWG